VRRTVWIILTMALALGACRQVQTQPDQPGEAPAAASQSASELTGTSESTPDRAKPDQSAAKSSTAGSEFVYFVYAGTYPRLERAEEVEQELAGLGSSAELIDMGDEVHVRVDRCDSYQRAMELREELMHSGYPKAFVTRSRGGPQSTGDSQEGEETLPADSAVAVEEEPPIAGDEIEFPEDETTGSTESDDPQWWEGPLDDPGCVLMTWQECLDALETNGVMRGEYSLELGNLRELLERNRYMVYVGSFRDREQAELAAARAGRRGIDLTVQPDEAGGWVAAASGKGEHGAAELHRQLDNTGLDNHARWELSASKQLRIRELEAALRELDRQDSAVRSYMTCFKY